MSTFGTHEGTVSVAGQSAHNQLIVSWIYPPQQLISCNRLDVKACWENHVDFSFYLKGQTIQRVHVVGGYGENAAAGYLLAWLTVRSHLCPPVREHECRVCRKCSYFGPLFLFQITFDWELFLLGCRHGWVWTKTECRPVHVRNQLLIQS